MRAWEALLLLPPWPALDPRPSLITGLDSSNSILRAFDLMWGWRSRAHSRGRGGAGAEGQDQESEVLAKGNGGLCHPQVMMCWG